MLHIVQVVLSGSAEIPKLFFDEAKAESAYVECAKEYWGQSYPAYCDRNGVSRDCFSSAKAFFKTFDLADKSRINYWIVKPEETGLDKLNLLLLGPESIKERREHILRLTKEVEQTSLAVKEGLTVLLDKIADLADNVDSLDGMFTDEQYVGRPEGDSVLPSSLLPQEEPEEIDEKYKTPEWKKYVESVKNMCGGSSGEFRLFTRHDWRQDVYSNLTSFEYWSGSRQKSIRVPERQKKPATLLLRIRINRDSISSKLRMRFGAKSLATRKRKRGVMPVCILTDENRCSTSHSPRKNREIPNYRGPFAEENIVRVASTDL